MTTWVKTLEDSIKAFATHWEIQKVTHVKILIRATEAAVRRFSSKFHKIHRRTPVLESLFNKVAGLKACNFIKNRLQHGCVVKFANLLRTSFFTEHLRWLLLEQHHTNVSFENFQILGNGHSDFRKWTFSK